MVSWTHEQVDKRLHAFTRKENGKKEINAMLLTVFSVLSSVFDASNIKLNIINCR